MGFLYFFFLLPWIFWSLSVSYNSREWNRTTPETPGGDTLCNFLDEFYFALDEADLNFEAMRYAFTGYDLISNNFRGINDKLITIIDYSMSSSEKRLFVIDLMKRKVIYKTYVAHGKNSGKNLAVSFSNQSQSYKSSLGFFITGNTYYGRHGYSLRLSGIEDEINDNAWNRGIVIHAASYVSEDYIHKYGRLGRSFGCPAIPVNEHEFLINLIKNRTCLFAYYPDRKYQADSKYLVTVQ